MTRNRKGKSKREKHDQTNDNGVSAIISDLEGEVNTLLAQKTGQEDKLASVLDKLSSESAVRTKLEARIKLLEAQAGFAEELSRESAITLNERKRICRVFEETKERLDALTAERDALAREVADTNGSQRKIYAVKTEVRRLRAKIADVSRITDKLAKVEQERDELDEKVRDLMRILTESRDLSNTMKLNLDATRQVVRDMYSQRETSDSQIQLLRKEIEDAGAKLGQTQNELASQTETGKQLERELRVLTEKYEAACSDRDTADEMYRDLRDGAVRIIERTRGIEYKDNNQELISEDNNQELALNEFVAAK